MQRSVARGLHKTNGTTQVACDVTQTSVEWTVSSLELPQELAVHLLPGIAAGFSLLPLADRCWWYAVQFHLYNMISPTLSVAVGRIPSNMLTGL